jgi:hypothetical protein
LYIFSFVLIRLGSLSITALERNVIGNGTNVKRSSSTSERTTRTDFQLSSSEKDMWPTFLLIGIVRGGVQLGPLGTKATNRPIVPAPGERIEANFQRQEKAQIHGGYYSMLPSLLNYPRLPVILK